MARNVKVAGFTGKTITTPYEGGMENAVNKMIAHWDKELGYVLSDKPDLIVLPECCDRFYNFTKPQNLEYYAYRGERIFDFFAEKAKKNNCYIAYSAVWPAKDGKNRNSVVMINRKGQIEGIYNKYNMTINEPDNIKGLCGDKAVIFNCDFGRVGAIICFDLNFRDILNLYKQKNPEIMIFASAYHGAFMQNYWAYELRSYLVSSVGYGCEAGIINPVGMRIASTSNYTSSFVKEINLDYLVAHLDYNYEEVFEAKKKYGSGFSIFEPKYLGAFLLSSEMDDVTMPQIAKEFSLESIDSYFQRSMESAKRHREIG